MSGWTAATRHDLVGKLHVRFDERGRGNVAMVRTEALAQSESRRQTATPHTAGRASPRPCTKCAGALPSVRQCRENGARGLPNGRDYWFAPRNNTGNCLSTMPRSAAKSRPGPHGNAPCPTCSAPRKPWQVSAAAPEVCSTAPFRDSDILVVVPAALGGEGFFAESRR